MLAYACSGRGIEVSKELVQRVLLSLGREKEVSVRDHLDSFA